MSGCCTVRKSATNTTRLHRSLWPLVRGDRSDQPGHPQRTSRGLVRIRRSQRDLGSQSWPWRHRNTGRGCTESEAVVSRPVYWLAVRACWPAAARSAEWVVGVAGGWVPDPGVRVWELTGAVMSEGPGSPGGPPPGGGPEPRCGCHGLCFESATPTDQYQSAGAGVVCVVSGIG